MAYFAALGGIITLAGVSLYHRFTQTPTTITHLLGDLDTVVRYVDDAQLIGLCRNYKSMLNNYRKRKAKIIFELEALHDSETQDFDKHAETCRTSMQKHLEYIRNYAAALKTAANELLEGLSAEQQKIINLKTGKKGLAQCLVVQVKTVTWEEILKGDIIAITDIQTSVDMLEQQLAEGGVTEAILQDNLKTWIELLSGHLGRIKF